VQANRQNELPSSSEQGDDEGPQTTYEEKVLADGTVVKIRKTSFSDASDDGTSYFGYHSTRVVSSSDESDDDDLDIGEDALFPPIGGMFGGGSDDDDEKCGPFCKIFRSLDKQLKNIETQLKEVQANRQNELPSSSEQGDDEGPQTTYEEKVLADGTVVKIRKTSFSDASDDGTSYFGYHSTRVVSSSDESDDDDSVEQVPDDVVQVELDEPKDSKPIKLTKLDNDSTLKRRKRRQTTNPFNQQQVQDLSFFNQVNPNAFNQISQNPFNQVRVQPQLVSPTLVRNLEKPKPISLEGDTRVNDLLLENARRGGLIRIDPDSEFIDGDGTIALSGHSQRGS